MTKRLDKLSPYHEIAIRMRIEGRSNEEIMERLGVKERTIHKWFSEPIVKEALEAQSKAINTLFNERMAGLGVASLDAMLAMVTEDHKGKLSPHQRLEVIREVLDRIPGMQKVQEPGAAPPPVGVQINNNTYAGLSDAELEAEARRLAGQVADETKALPSGNGSAAA